MDRTSNLGGSFLCGDIKNILNEFSSADEENEWNIESKVTRCIWKGGSFEMFKRFPLPALVFGS